MHDAITAPGGTDLTVDVRNLTRVEGEGSLHLRVRDGAVESARLEIFEAPRYFERLVIDRSMDEVIDIVARICGICPVAYQMTAVHAAEAAFGVEVDPATVALRRLLYCGEWIESHALHVYLLHLPDLLGYPSALDLAQHDRMTVERGLRLKRTGNGIVARIGGRAIHPVSVRVGGFSRVIRRDEIASLRTDLVEALEIAEATVELVAGLQPSTFRRDARLVALRDPRGYPMNHGRIVSNDGLDIPAADWESMFEEHQVAWSHALQASGRDGQPYLLGPSSRVTLDGDLLHPRAAAALSRLDLGDRIAHDPNWSIAARAVELVHAVAEAIDIVDAYEPPPRALVPWTPRAGIAGWATEAPRGMLFQRFVLDRAGRVREARIVPPTSQNQAAIEADLALFAPTILDRPRAEITHLLEQLIRSYDPCISCATHFLDVRVEDVS
ncbi:MAG TPA: Ni/Fe hydrogenase subunit alpha [Candidatus Limnocylindrales bacterium]|nr:Ni/Fe hydrogenase subunit alpha [Candidatus Limnocylindrales bacterium]